VLPRGFDEASAVHDFVRASLSSELHQAMFRDGDIAGIDSALIPHAGLAAAGARGAHTGKHPEDSAETVLNQVFRVWDRKRNRSRFSPPAGLPAECAAASSSACAGVGGTCWSARCAGRS